jgi:DNA-binding XRE family transcriptional regulator
MATTPIVAQRADIGGGEPARRQDAKVLLDQFATNLRQARTKAGMTQETLATACDLHRTYISTLEQGRTDPRVTMVARLADALGIAPGDLLVASKDPGTGSTTAVAGGAASS